MSSDFTCRDGFLRSNEVQRRAEKEKVMKISSMKISLLTLLVLLLGSACAMNAQPGTALSSNAAMYARVVRLSHNANASNNGQIIASVTAFPNGNAEEDIYASKDGGATFTQVGAVQDPDFAGGLCCGELYELPSAVGQLAPGTLLWAGSVGQTSTSKPMQIKVYQSTNQGATWTYLSPLHLPIMLQEVCGSRTSPLLQTVRWYASIPMRPCPTIAN
jgi:hypothetical protein